VHGRILGYMVGLPVIFGSNSGPIDSIFHRDNVETLIKHVPEARYKGFSTHAAAAEHYLNAKKALKVKIVRDPGDERKYGGMRSAAQ
jgi:hypothetical protein